MSGEAFASSLAVFLVAILIAGAALGIAVMPSLFAILPNDLERYRTILHALATTNPRIVVFGDSRGAAGIDCRQLTSEIEGHPLALNLSAHGVGLPDVLLLMQEVPASARLVVVVMGRDRFAVNQFPDLSYNVLFMYGYRPDADTRRDIGDAFGAEEGRRIDRPPIAEILASRWTVRQAADMLVRDAMRGRKARLSERDDLFLPIIYERRLDRRRFAAALSLLRRESITHASMDSTSQILLRRIARTAARKHQRVLLVLAPADPGALDRQPLSPFSDPKSIANVSVLDATSLLGDTDFADPLHPTPAGARKLTSFVARGIEALP